MIRTKRIGMTGAICAMLVCFLGCSSEPGQGRAPDEGTSNQPPAQSTSKGSVSGQRLYSLTLGDSHTLEFWELSDRSVAAHEVLPVGAKPVITDTVPSAGATLADIYRAAVPESNEVPQAILDADTRAASFAPPPNVSSAVPKRQEGVDSNANQILPTAQIGSAGACSADLLNDNFGAQWFLNNYCKGGDHRWCLTNRTSGFTGTWDVGGGTSWFRWSVMAADFYVGAETRGGYPYIQCRSNSDGDPFGPLNTDCITVFDQLFDDMIPARTIDTWTLRGFEPYEGWAIGNSACQRVHYANEWTDN